MYRSLLAGKRVLVLLDNARDAEHVRPLLPGSPTTLVLVTSRNQLPSLVAAEGARPLTLDLLPPADARRLLSGRLGDDRLTAEPRSVDELIDRCSRLPLALTIVAARAATNTRFPLEALAGELRDTRSRLDAFDAGDPAADVRAVFSWSYRTLSDDAARLFRLLGLHPGPDLAAPAAASLAGLPVPRTRALLAELARANLVAEAVPGRYGFHDLLRAYATDLAAEQDSEPERRAARHRMLDHYLHTAFVADRLQRPHRDVIAVAPPVPGVAVEHLADADRALAWFAAEHAVLVAAITLAAGAGHDAHAWQLAATIGDFLDRRGHWQEWATIQQTALAAARRSGDRAGQARCHRDLGRAYTRLGRMAEALTHYGHALELYAALDDHAGQANTVLDMAWVANLQSDHPRALEQAGRALELFRRADHQYGQANALNAVGWEYVLVGDPRQALTCCEQALSLFRELGDRRSEASTWDSVGYAQHHLGEYEQALASYRNALELYRATGGDRYYEADTLNHAGDTHLAAGAADAAAQAWREALALLEEMGHPEAAAIRAKLATAARERGVVNS
jgi:tetratricopeptide (TPR) repeat protein